MAITAQEGKKLLEELGEKALLLDVRHAHEYALGHIPGAVLLDNDDIEAGVRHPFLPEDLDRPIIIYCRSGVIAARASEATTPCSNFRRWVIPTSTTWAASLTGPTRLKNS